MQVFGDVNVLDRKLLTAIGRLTDAEVQAVLEQVRSEGFDGVAWFASPEDAARAAVPSIDPILAAEAFVGKPTWGYYVPTVGAGLASVALLAGGALLYRAKNKGKRR